MNGQQPSTSKSTFSDTNDSVDTNASATNSSSRSDYYGDYSSGAPSTSRRTARPVRCQAAIAIVETAAESSLRYQRPAASPLLGAFAIINLLMTFGAANGYVVGRLLDRDTFQPLAGKDYVFVAGQAVGPTRSHRAEMTSEIMFEALREIFAAGEINVDVDDNDAGRRTARRAGRRRKAKRQAATTTASAEWSDEKRLTTVAQPLELRLRRKFPRDTTQKKSVLKSLKKLSSNNVRNCFFTPIQCMIQHDMSKYKKLIENNSDGFTTTKM